METGLIYINLCKDSRLPREIVGRQRNLGMGMAHRQIPVVCV